MESVGEHAIHCMNKKQHEILVLCVLKGAYLRYGAHSLAKGPNGEGSGKCLICHLNVWRVCVWFAGQMGFFALLPRIHQPANKRYTSGVHFKECRGGPARVGQNEGKGRRTEKKSGSQGFRKQRKHRSANGEPRPRGKAKEARGGQEKN